MKKNRTPEQREAMRVAYWQKWAGTMPATVIRTKGIDYDSPWNVTKITPAHLDKALREDV